jgi:hypothetical protein
MRSAATCPRTATRKGQERYRRKGLREGRIWEDVEYESETEWHMKCAQCQQEIPPSRQEFLEVNGKRIPLPCERCREELKKQSEAFDLENRKKLRGD